MKEWYKSKAVWGGVIAAVAGIAANFGININETLQADISDWIVSAVAIVGGLLSIYGRIVATKQIGPSK